MKLNSPIVILANGDYPKNKVPLNILNNAKSIICLDGAIKNLLQNNLQPSIIIGDLDSIRPNYKKKYQDIIIEIKDQSQNDLRKSIFWLDEKSFKSVTILGASGKREDHFIGNIFGILDMNYSIDIHMVTDFGTFQILKKGSYNIPSYIGQNVSFFTSKKPAKISVKNLRYSFIKNYVSDSFSYTLNESISSSFQVDVLTEKVLMFTTHK